MPYIKRNGQGHILGWVRHATEGYTEFVEGEVTLHVPQGEVDADLKLTGILINGVMCSATKEDMWGLAAIRPFIQAGNSVPYEFSNGNVLVLTPLTFEAFEDAWTEFRLSFFPLP